MWAKSPGRARERVVGYGLQMAIIRYLFLTMTIRFFQAARNPDTRLSYTLPGPIVFVAGWVLVFMRQPPPLSLSLIFAGSAAMRIQASMVEKRQGTSFRNTAILIVLMAAVFAALGDWEWAPVLVVIAAGLYWLQRYHDKNVKVRDYRSQIGRLNEAKSQLDT